MSVAPLRETAAMLTDADRALALVAASQHGVFSIDDARRAGLTRPQIEWRVSGVWRGAYEGVFRFPGAPETYEGALLAACMAATNPSAVSHRSAAALYGFPGGRNDLVEITCRRWRRSQKPGLVVHESTRFDECDIVERDRIPVVRAERLILELAGLRPTPGYVEMLMHAARRKRLITYESTLQTFERLARRGVPGVRAMRVALEHWNPDARPSESDMETQLLQTLRAHGLPEPVLQYEVNDERGLVVARVDAAFPQWRIVIEYDSKQEHSDEFQIARDARRRNEVTAAGFAVLTARYGDLKNGGQVLADEIHRIARRSAS